MEQQKSEYRLAKDIPKVLVFVAVPLAIIAIILAELNIIEVYKDGDFTNAFGFFIELGIGLFISLLLFRYSNAQQDRSTRILTEVSTTTNKLREVTNELEQQKEQRRQVVLSGISNTLIGMWMTAQSAVYVICKNGFKEPDFDNNLSDSVKDNLKDYKRSMERGLEQLNNLVLLGSEGLDANMISALVALHDELKLRTLTETTIGRMAYPWSGTISAIDKFAKEHFQSLTTHLFLLPDIEEYIPADILKTMKEKSKAL